MDGRTVKTPRRLQRPFLDAFTLTLTRRAESSLSVDARQLEGHYLPLLLERERRGADSHSLDCISSILVVVLPAFFWTQFHSLLGFGSR